VSANRTGSWPSSPWCTVAARRRILAVALRSRAVWAVLPVVLGLDVMTALSRDAGWRGELDSLAEALAPVLMLLSPFLAGVGAWLAHEDRALDASGLLRSCTRGRRHIALRVAVAAALPAGLHLLVLTVLGIVSLRTASVGGWPVGPVLVQLAAFPAFCALGYVIGWYVDHLVGPLVAAGVALLAAYTDYGNERWPLGFITGGRTGSLAGHDADPRAVLGRLAFCAAVTGLALLTATWAFGASRSRWAAQATAGALLLVLGGVAVQAHPEIWVEQVPAPVRDHCVGEAPRVCVLPDFAGLAGRAAGIADRAAALVRSTGASGLRDTYVGWFPGAPPGDIVTVFDQNTAYQPAGSLVIVGDVVAPKGCPQWYSGVDLDRESAAEQVVLTWLVGRDPSLSGGEQVQHAGADLAGFRRRTPAEQRARVAELATALATCRFAVLPRQGTPL
jgi:hypothetical protein